MYRSDPFLMVFDQQPEEGAPVRMDAVNNQRTKSIKSGPILEIVSSPVWNTKGEADQARKIVGKTREAQRKLNARNRKLRQERLMNGNFGPGDLLVTLTHPVGRQPVDLEDAQRQIGNYIKRVKTMRRRKRLGAMKYMYVIEQTESVRYGVRYHYHMIMSGAGVDRDEAEALWYKKTRGTCNTRRYQRQAGHLSGWSVYMTMFKPDQKKPTYRAWGASKNLIDPEASATVSETKISRRQAQRMAMGGEDAARAALAKLYPGYEILEVSVRTSAFVQGVYVYAKMRMPEAKAKRKRGARVDAGDAGGAATRGRRGAGVVTG